MAKPKGRNKNCRDVFNAFLVSKAVYDGPFEFPIIHPTHSIPNRLIAFSKAVPSKDYDQWVHFFEEDYKFERLWRDPMRYLEILRRFNGVILPDFSVYRDMPFAMQVWNIYRSRAIGAWLQGNGVKVIVNVRYGDERTCMVCCSGAPKRCTIAVGSYGTLQDADNRRYFIDGLRVVVEHLDPETIVVYGPAPYAIFDAYRRAGITIVPFESETSLAHQGAR